MQNSRNCRPGTESLPERRHSLWSIPRSGMFQPGRLPRKSGPACCLTSAARDVEIAHGWMRPIDFDRMPLERVGQSVGRAHPQAYSRSLSAIGGRDTIEVFCSDDYARGSGDHGTRLKPVCELPLRSAAKKQLASLLATITDRLVKVIPYCASSGLVLCEPATDALLLKASRVTASQTLL
jgi:hypothetical protein